MVRNHCLALLMSFLSCHHKQASAFMYRTHWTAIRPTKTIQRVEFSASKNLISSLVNDHDHKKSLVNKWVDDWVIGLGLCPWARSVRKSNMLKLTVLDSIDDAAITTAISNEVSDMFDIASATESVLIILPQISDFYDFLDIISTAENHLADTGVDNNTQIASFHPEYQFQGSRVDDVTNYTNRSPYPIIHLLKVQQVTDAIDAVKGDTSFVWKNNMRRLNEMGIKKVTELHMQYKRQK